MYVALPPTAGEVVPIDVASLDRYHFECHSEDLSICCRSEYMASSDLR
jgi:hypothetical protein